MQFDLKNLKNTLLILVGLLGTGVGAFGGLPVPPKIFSDLTQRYELLQWVLVYVLIWQGAGSYDELVSLLGTIFLYILYKIVEKLSKNKKLYKLLDLPIEEENKEKYSKY